MRIEKAQEELKYENKYDVVIINDQLSEALSEAETTVKKFINS
jgi:guanylate kinase